MSRLHVIGRLAGLLLIGCACSVCAQDLTPEDKRRISLAVLGYIECSDCLDAQEDALAKAGDHAVTLLAGALHGPSPAMRLTRKLALERFHADNVAAARRAGIPVRLGPQAPFVERELARYALRYARRAGQGLALIGSAAAKQALGDALRKDDFPADVRTYLQALLTQWKP